MKIYVTNFSTQLLNNTAITYIATPSGIPVTDLVTLGPVDPSGIGTNASSTQQASSCTSISVPFNGGSEIIMYGQAHPVPNPIGFHLKARWSQSGTAIIVVLDDEIGGY